MLRYFGVSYFISIMALVLSFWWGGWSGLVIGTLLVIMEVTFSFDNAIVNAAILTKMDEKWQRRFLTWGILFAVFGMRLVFPVLIVAVATGLGMVDVVKLSLEDPANYTKYVMQSHSQIAAFGGTFLLMVFLHFMFDETKELHWIGTVEKKLARLGKLESMEAVTALSILLLLQHFLPAEEKLSVLVAGTVGVVLYVVVKSITALASNGEDSHSTVNALAYNGLAGFIYLNLLDASFSLDGVIGAFAISQDIIIIMLGLGAGAMYVRSVTIYLVHKGTLGKYVFLEHGAHYGIGALAIIMLLSIHVHVSEIITGLIGIAFIFLSLYSSVRYTRKQKTLS